jgi:hypothetical protein
MPDYDVLNAAIGVFLAAGAAPAVVQHLIGGESLVIASFVMLTHPHPSARSNAAAEA